PVLAGDTLVGKSIVLEQRPSASRPGIGLVKLRHELYNQRGVLVSHGENTVMFLMRGNGGVAA
ncbi:MaoC family dehydratase, partial [Escherichia coli]